MPMVNRHEKSRFRPRTEGSLKQPPILTYKAPRHIQITEKHCIIHRPGQVLWGWIHIL